MNHIELSNVGEYLDSEYDKHFPKAKLRKMYRVWKGYHKNSVNRGLEIIESIEKHRFMRNKVGNTRKMPILLDIGSGLGGLSFAASLKEYRVVSMEFNIKPLIVSKSLRDHFQREYIIIHGDAMSIPLKFDTVDVIICSDLIEHVSNAEGLLQECNRVLKNGGILYITTPNKVSPYNILSDPHYGHFGICLLPKKIAAFYTAKIMKWPRVFGVERYFTHDGFSKILEKFSFKHENIVYTKILEKLRGPIISKFWRFVLRIVNRLPKLLKEFIIKVYCRYWARSFRFVCIKTSG